ncbi:MAG: hypothetical protein ACXABI_06375 [Candidatus Hodarchaeales archaeon]|jgi:hypothetical protein
MTTRYFSRRVEKEKTLQPICLKSPPKSRFAPLRRVLPVILIILLGINLFPLILARDDSFEIIVVPRVDILGNVNSLVQTTDGGFALVGEVRQADVDYGPCGTWLVKTDANGQPEWNKTFAYQDGSISASSLIQAANGGYTIAGVIPWTPLIDAKSFFLKTNAYGRPQGFQTYEGGGASALIQTTDGGFVLTGPDDTSGDVRDDLWLMKTDVTGHHQWTNILVGIASESASSLIQTTDGGYAGIAVKTGTFDMVGDFWLVKTDANGIVQWNQTYRDPDFDSASIVFQSVDGGFVLAGRTDSDDGKRDMWLVKTDATGIAQWNQNYSGYYLIDPTNRNPISSPEALVSTTDGGFALAGVSFIGWGLFPNIWLVKTDANGVFQWNQSFGGAGRATISALVLTADGGFALAGTSNDDFWLVKTDANGVVQWNQTYRDYNLEVIILSRKTTTPGQEFLVLVPLPLFASLLVLTVSERIRRKRIK